MDCQMFGKRAEVINKYLHKGDQLLVEGRLKFETCDAKDGSKRSTLRVFIESFEFMGKAKTESPQPRSGPVDEPIDEDIPF